MAEQYWEKYTDGNGIEWGTLLIDYDDVDNAGARGNLSVAIGKANLAYGEMSFAAGCRTKALGAASSSDGIHTVAGGKASHAGGYYTKTTNDAEFAVGRFNESTSDLTIFSVGNGEDEETRSNALEVTLDDKTIVKKLQVLNPGDTTAIAGLGLDEDNNVVLIEGSTSGVNDGKFTITAAGTTISEFTANQEGDTTLDISTDNNIEVTKTLSGLNISLVNPGLAETSPLSIKVNGLELFLYQPAATLDFSLNLVAGSGIELTPADNNQITIRATNLATVNDGVLRVYAGNVLAKEFSANSSLDKVIQFLGSGGTSITSLGDVITINSLESIVPNNGQLLIKVNNTNVQNFGADLEEDTSLQIVGNIVSVPEPGVIEIDQTEVNDSRIQFTLGNRTLGAFTLNQDTDATIDIPEPSDADIYFMNGDIELGSFSLNLGISQSIDLADWIPSPSELTSPFEFTPGSGLTLTTNIQRVDINDSINGSVSIAGKYNTVLSVSDYRQATFAIPTSLLIATTIIHAGASKHWIGASVVFEYEGTQYSATITDVTNNREMTLDNLIISDADLYNEIHTQYPNTVSVRCSVPTIINAENCMVLGCEHTITSGYRSLIGGRWNKIIYPSDSVIVGYRNDFSNILESIAFGLNNNVETISWSVLGGIGNTVNTVTGSIIEGISNKAISSQASLIAGDTNTVLNSSNLTMVGFKNSADHVMGSIVGGYQNVLELSANSNTVNGSSNTIQGASLHNAVFGELNTLSAQDSLVGGTYNQAANLEGSIVVGLNNYVLSIDSAIIGGSENDVTGSATLVGGTNNVVEGNNGVVVGNHLHTTNDEESALGYYNNSTEDSTLFSIGSGTANTPKNALEVTTDDTTIIRKGKILEPLTGTPVSYLALDSNNNIISAAGSGGGSNVSYTQTFQPTSADLGVEVGRITIDSNTTTIYSPLAKNSSITFALESTNHIFELSDNLGTITLNLSTDDVITIPSVFEFPDYGTYSIKIRGSQSTVGGEWALALGDNNTATGDYSISEGDHTLAIDTTAHAEGYYTIAEGESSHAEGAYTKASNNGAHAEGYGTSTTYNQALGEGSHAEGRETIAYKDFSHVEGQNTRVGNSEGTYDGEAAHAEGYRTVVSGDYAHAEGCETFAQGDASHTEGVGTITNSGGEHACGRYNNSHPYTGWHEDPTEDSETIFSVGIGSADNSRKNAVEITANGFVYITEVGGYHGDESELNVHTSMSLLSYLAALELRILALELQLNNL